MGREIESGEEKEKKRSMREGEKKELRGERIKTLTGHFFPIISVVFSADGEYLASGSSDNTIRVWRVSSGERIKTLRGHTSFV